MTISPYNFKYYNLLCFCGKAFFCILERKSCLYFKFRYESKKFIYIYLYIKKIHFFQCVFYLSDKMRLGDKDYFQCPDCTSILPRQMFSSHPALCTNKSETKQARTKDQGSPTVSEKSRDDKGNFKSTHLKTSHLANSLPEHVIIQDQPLMNVSKNQEFLFTCQYCEFYSPYKGTLKIHKKINHLLYENNDDSEIQPIFSTNHRPKLVQVQTKTDISFDRGKYKPDHHNNSRAIICSVCGANFNHQSSLRKHTEVRHGDVINFPCDECGQMFPRRSKKCSQQSSVQPIRPGLPAQFNLPLPLGQWLLICTKLPSSRGNVLCVSPQCPVPRTDMSGCRISCSGGDESLVLDRW